MRSLLRGVFRALAFTVGLAVVLWIGCGAAVVIFASADTARRADAIVVLGAAQYAGKPSPVLRARLDHALGLWRRGLATRLIVTGGVGAGDTTSEAAVARRYVERRGIPGGLVLVETRGRTTSESMHAVGAIMRANGLHDAILVSDPFHMFRLWLLARRNGFVGHTSPRRMQPPEAASENRWRYILSESLKAPLAFFME